MSTFLEIATPLAKMGIPMTPIRPGTKRAFLPDFPTTATTNLEQLQTWDVQFPDHGGACVARAEDGGVWFWEVDSTDVWTRLQKDTGHDAFAEIQTFRVRSRPGRGHYYFRHNAASMGLGNISQTYVIGQDWSVRTHREYVVAPGSIHPDTGEPYQALDWSVPIAEAPQWLIDWLQSQRIQKHSAPQGATIGDAPRNANGRIPHGAIHGWMLSQAGKLRQAGLDQGEIEPVLMRLVHEQCEPPIDDARVRAMAKSICNFPPGEDKSLVLNQKPTVQVEEPASIEPEEDIDYSESEYPVFPEWIMYGTSLYEGYVKPYCEKNSRVDYFMWVPAAVMMMNYLGLKVKVPYKSWKPSFFIVLIGQKGRSHKSSSIKDAMKYLNQAGVLEIYSKEIKNAEGKTLVSEAGSPEGLGSDMMRTNCKNAILFYDELSVLVSKARIEGSGMNGALLKLYESANFANSTKVKKENYSLAPDSYVASLITATTDQRYKDLWSQFAGADTGLNERFTFILGPEKLGDERLEEVVPTIEAALETRKLIDKAVAQGDYKFFDQTPFEQALKLYGTRAEIRAEKWALYFAVDLGRKEIDEDCVERGIRMAKYEQQVRTYLKTFEAKNEEASIQQRVILLLKRYKGSVEKRVIERQLNMGRHGTTVWNKAYYGLVKNGYIAETGKGSKGDPMMVVLLRDMTFED